MHITVANQPSFPFRRNAFDMANGNVMVLDCLHFEIACPNYKRDPLNLFTPVRPTIIAIHYVLGWIINQPFSTGPPLFVEQSFLFLCLLIFSFKSFSLFVYALRVFLYLLCAATSLLCTEQGSQVLKCAFARLCCLVTNIRRPRLFNTGGNDTCWLKCLCLSHGQCVRLEDPVQ